ncbi:MAG: alpha/beta hydrolase, partial [Luteimonas sp.]
MSSKRLSMAALLILVMAFTTGCISGKVRSQDLVRSSPSAPLDVAAARAALPGYTVADRRISMADGVKLYAVAFTRPDARATVLYFGGNGYKVGLFGIPTVKNLGAAPVNVVLVDHRGYGASEGSPTLEAMFADAPQVYDAVHAWPELGGRPLIVHGQSIGSFMAGTVARQRTLDGLVLESSMTTGEAWGQMYEDHWMVRRVEVEGSLREAGNLPVMRTLDEPLLVLVGANDKATPPKYSRELFEAAAVPAARKRLVVMAGRGHNESPPIPASPRCTAASSTCCRRLRLVPSDATMPAAESARQSRHPSTCWWMPRKVRAPQGTVPGNAWAARADGKCN